MIAILWVYIYKGYQLDLRLSSLLAWTVCKLFFSKIIHPFPQKSHECALKLTDLWNTIASLSFDLNYKFQLTGASLLALAKSIYYMTMMRTNLRIRIRRLFKVIAHLTLEGHHPHPHNVYPKIR